MNYNGWLKLSAMQWLNYNSFWVKGLKDDLTKGAITQPQYDAIWRHREKLVTGYRDGTGKDALPDPTVNNSWGNLDVDVSDVTDALKKDIKAIGDALGGGSKYVLYGIAGVVLILILGRR